jgi:hypothetical protein
MNIVVWRRKMQRTRAKTKKADGAECGIQQPVVFQPHIEGMGAWF